MTSQNQGNENDYMEEDHEMANVYDDIDEEFQGRGISGMESDDDEYDHMDNKITDTLSAQARGGKDIQGIPWERLNVTREKYRQTRLEQYKNYESVPQSREESEKPTKKGGMYYDFRLNTTSVKSTILHFQVFSEEIKRPGIKTAGKVGSEQAIKTPSIMFAIFFFAFCICSPLSPPCLDKRLR